MIKINKDQRDELREILREFDEKAANKNQLLIYDVGEVKEFTIAGKNGAVRILRPELPEDRSSRKTILHTGMVLSVGEGSETSATEGDLVRYYPGSAEEIETAGGKFTFYQITIFDLRSISHSVDDSDESKFLEVDKVPITDTRIN